MASGTVTLAVWQVIAVGGSGEGPQQLPAGGVHGAAQRGDSPDPPRAPLALPAPGHDVHLARAGDEAGMPQPGRLAHPHPFSGGPQPGA